MRKISLNKEPDADFTIMIFVEGTIMKPKSWFSLYHHTTYVPIGNAVKLIKTWEQQNANIMYCTSRRKKQAENIAALLKKYEFPGSCLICREPKERYKTIVESLQPNVLIEDDCKSIGGAWQMCITKVNPAIKEKIRSIVVPEFKGIDHLPMNIRQL